MEEYREQEEGKEGHEGKEIRIEQHVRFVVQFLNLSTKIYNIITALALIRG